MAPPIKKARSNSGEAVNTTPSQCEKTTLPQSAEGKKHFPNPPLAPATEQDKREWTGFVERESEPAFFNVLLRDWGVKGVKMQEVVFLDDSVLAELSKPIYGLLFLFRWHSRDSSRQEEQCPPNVWFANQIQDNACSSVSLLNLLNNAPGADLGRHLQQLKDFTKDFSPFMRGTIVNNSEVVRRNHNRLARKMQMLQDDMTQQNKFNAHNAKKKAPKGKRNLKRKHSDEEVADDDAAHHYLAFVPVEGSVWLLDGMERQPYKVGSYADGEDWMEAVKPIIAHEMALSDSLDFNIMALVRDPILEKQKRLATNVKTLQTVEGRLTEMTPDWEVMADKTAGERKDQKHALRGASDEDGLSEELFSEAQDSTAYDGQLDSDDPAVLLKLQQQLVTAQSYLRTDVRGDLMAVEDEEKTTKERAHDYSELIHTWLGYLAGKEEAVRHLIEYAGY